jgi:hypothetical protein
MIHHKASSGFETAPVLDGWAFLSWLETRGALRTGSVCRNRCGAIGTREASARSGDVERAGAPFVEERRTSSRADGSEASGRMR